MKSIALKLRKAAFMYLKWAWPLLFADAALAAWAGESESAWRRALNTAAFAWVLCAPIAPLSLVFDRARRERAMGRLCGLKEGDERERRVTGEAARSTLLLALSLQLILLILSLVSVRLDYDPTKPKGSGRGNLQVGLSFSTEKHLNPYNSAPASIENSNHMLFGGYVVAPSTFPILAVLILFQLAAFKAFAMRRYEGEEE